MHCNNTQLMAHLCLVVHLHWTSRLRKTYKLFSLPHLFSGLTIDLCAKCKRGPKDQVSIPGGHSYCKQCVSVLVSPKPLQHQHSESSHHYAGPGDVACDLCTEKKLKAVRSCLNCTASYCESHVKQHYIVAALRKHTLVEVTGNLEQKLCQLHHKALEVFCKTDQILVCNVCAVEDHRGHRKCYIEVRNYVLYLFLLEEHNIE